MLSLSLKPHRRGSKAVVLTSAVVFGLALTLLTFFLVVVVAQFNTWDHFCFTFFKCFQTSLQIYSSRFTVEL